MVIPMQFDPQSNVVIMGNIEASFIARLKNKSKEQGIPLQQLINLFCQEEFIRRLSESDCKEKVPVSEVCSR